MYFGFGMWNLTNSILYGIYVWYLCIMYSMFDFIILSYVCHHNGRVKTLLNLVQFYPHILDTEKTLCQTERRELGCTKTAKALM